MLTNISWNQYILVVVLLLVSWYLLVGLRFYKEALQARVTGKRKLRFHRGSEDSNTESKEELDPDGGHQGMEINTAESQSDLSDAIFSEIDGLVKRLKNVITDAKQRKLDKQEFEDYMRLILKNYPLLRDSPYRSAVDELIVSECEKIGSFLLTQKEVEGFWVEFD